MAKILIFAIAAATAFGVVAFVASLRDSKKVIVVVPTGYRGDVLIVESADGVSPEKRAGEVVYIVPSSGVLRVRSIDRLSAFISTAPAESRGIHCLESVRGEIPNRISPTSDLYFSLDGPYGSCRIGLLSIWSKDDRKWPRISTPEMEQLCKSGVPADFVSPHVIE